MTESISVATSLPMSYHHRPAKSGRPRQLALFLHGFTDHGGSFLKRLFKDQWAKELPDTLADTAILAPNGPFPTPVKVADGWREAYSWYFYQESIRKMVIGPETATLGCQQMIRLHGYENLPKVLIGFSQGGYLAAHLASHLKDVKELIGIATGFREDYYPKGAPWRLTAIHGSDDEVFPIAVARENHAVMKNRVAGGDFFEIPGLGHSASEEVGAMVEKRLAQLSLQR